MNISELNGNTLAGQINAAQITPEALSKASSEEKSTKPLMGDSSVRVITSTEVDRMVEQLKVEHEDRKRDLSRARLADAITVLMGASVNGIDKQIVEEIDEKLDKINTDTSRADWLGTDIEKLQKNLAESQASLNVLMLKTQEVEAAIERIRKTPEEQRTEAQKKELAELEAQKSELDKQKGVLDAKIDQLNTDISNEQTEKSALETEIATLNAEISSLYGKLSTTIRTAIAESGKYRADVNKPDNDSQNKPKKVGEPDAADQLAALLSGDTLADIIAAKRQVKI